MHFSSVSFMLMCSCCIKKQERPRRHSCRERTEWAQMFRSTGAYQAAEQLELSSICTSRGQVIDAAGPALLAGCRVKGNLARRSSRGRPILARGDLLTRLLSRWLVFQRRLKICFSLRAVEIDCDRLAPAWRVWLARGGDNCRVLLSEKAFLMQSRLSASRWSPGVSLVWESLGHTSTLMQIPQVYFLS